MRELHGADLDQQTERNGDGTLMWMTIREVPPTWGIADPKTGEKPSMGFEQFLEALWKTPRDWRLSEHTKKCDRAPLVRRGYGMRAQCPISVLANMDFMHYQFAAEKLGINQTLMLHIVHASDGKFTERDNELKAMRIKILAATGLLRNSI
jgi:hypothetical protein